MLCAMHVRDPFSSAPDVCTGLASTPCAVSSDRTRILAGQSHWISPADRYDHNFHNFDVDAFCGIFRTIRSLANPVEMFSIPEFRPLSRPEWQMGGHDHVQLVSHQFNQAGR